MGPPSDSFLMRLECRLTSVLRGIRYQIAGMSRFGLTSALCGRIVCPARDWRQMIRKETIIVDPIALSSYAPPTREAPSGPPPLSRS